MRTKNRSKRQIHGVIRVDGKWYVNWSGDMTWEEAHAEAQRRNQLERQVFELAVEATTKQPVINYGYGGLGLTDAPVPEILFNDPGVEVEP